MNTTTAAEIRARRRGMTQTEMLADMSTSELAKNIHRGGIAAKEEQERRDQFFQIARGGTDLERCCIIEAMQPDWRICIKHELHELVMDARYYFGKENVEEVL